MKLVIHTTKYVTVECGTNFHQKTKISRIFYKSVSMFKKKFQLTDFFLKHTFGQV